MKAPRSKRQLDDVLAAHSAIVALLESTVISLATRSHLERLREELEDEIAAVRKCQQEKLSA